MAPTEYHLAGFIPLIRKWRRPVLGVTLAGFVISIFTAWLLPDIYRSTAVFYPTNFPDLETALNPAVVINGQKLELSTSADDADRLISIGQSVPLVQVIIRKYQLAQRYGYSPTDTSDKVRQKVLEEFLYNYTITQNNRSAVEVSFEDADKYFAARVANSIIHQIDAVNQQLTRENQQKITTIYRQRHEKLQQEIEKTQEKLLAARRQYGIFGSNIPNSEGRPESRYLAERLVQTETDLRQANATLSSYQSQLTASHPKIIALKATIKGLKAALVTLKNTKAGNSINLESYLAGTDEVTRLEMIFTARQEEYVKALQAYEDAQLRLTNTTTSMYIVQHAYPATKKVRPIRWLLVAGATLFTFLLSVTAVGVAARWSVARPKALFV